MGAAALAFAAAAALLRAAQPTYPSGDQALLEIYTRQALDGTLQLGAYSRFGWHHPGPLLFYLLAPVYAAGGASEVSLYASAAVINVAAIAGAVWLLRTYAGNMASLVLLAAYATYVYRSGDLIASAWNPHAPILAVPLFIILCAAVADGAAFAWPGAAGAATFLVQSHVGFAGVCLALLVASSAAAIRRHGAPAGRRRTFAAIGLTLLVAYAAWAPPLGEQFGAGAGNLTALRAFFAAPRPLLAADAAAGVFARAWSALVDPASMDIHAAFLAAGTASPPWLAMLLVGAGFLSVGLTRSHPFLHALSWLTLIASAAAFVSVRYAGEGVEDHQVYWIAILGMTTVCTSLMGALVWSRARLPQGRRSLDRDLRSAKFLLIAVVACLSVQSIRSQHARALRTEAATRRLAQAADGFVRSRGAPAVLVRTTPRAWPQAAGLVLALLRSGVRVGVEAEAVFMFGEALRATAQESVELYVVDEGLAPQIDLSGYERIGRFAQLFVFAKPRL